MAVNTLTHNNVSRMAGHLAEPIAMITALTRLAIETVDMRIGIEGLCGRLVQSLGKSLSDGSVYVFPNRRSTRIKVLMWAHTGVWLCQCRLHQGSFVWPTSTTAVFELK